MKVRQMKIEQIKKFSIKLFKANYLQVLFVFIAFSVMSLTGYFYGSNIISAQTENIWKESAGNMHTYVSERIIAADLLFSGIYRTANDMLKQGRSNSEILEYLKAVQRYYDIQENEDTPMPYFLYLYAYFNGEYIDATGWRPDDPEQEGYDPDYKPVERPWYVAAVAAPGKITHTEPYVDAHTGETCISISRTLSGPDGAGEYYVLSLDIDLKHIVEFINEQQISNNGYGVFINDSMLFLTHKNKDFIGESIYGAGGDYEGLANMLKSGQPVSSFEFRDYDGTKSVAFFDTVFGNWYIGTITPQSSYRMPITNLAVMTSLLGFSLAILLSAVIIRTNIRRIISEEQSKIKSSFLARMSHEIRTPMNAIIGMVEIAHKSDDNRKKNECIYKINVAAKHLLDVINDVLDMSKIEAGKLETSPVDFVFSEMMDRILVINRPKMDEKNQVFTLTVDDKIPDAIIADQKMLVQVISNLLSNAIKFTPDGGRISLSVKLEKANSEIRLLFEVKDNGIGISEKNRKKLFSAFEQADNTISRKYGGTGLGLAICKKMVEMMGGQIWIKSEEGKGSSFFFTVTAHAGKAKAAAQLDGFDTVPENAAAGEAIFKGKKILVAEDIVINQEILLELLGHTGIEIIFADNGMEAYEIFRKSPDMFDIIFMDIHMPVMDGFEATKKIRALPIMNAKNIPIIAMTADVFNEDIEKCRADGMNDHTGKPIEIKDVIKKIGYYTGVYDKNAVKP